MRSGQRLILVLLLAVLGTTSLLLASLARKRELERPHAQAELRRLTQALAVYRAEFGVLPDDYVAALTGVNFVDPADCLDPWGRPYAYALTADRLGFTIVCLGADGRPGGEGRAADLTASAAAASSPGSLVRPSALLVALGVLLLGTVFVTAISSGADALRRRRRLRAGQCPRCRYPLAPGGSSACPECGWRRPAPTDDRPSPG